jgi:DNA-directed RNA polymerase subunit N (RpoN/RPB10)
MIIPVRCFSCNKVLADLWVYYEKKCKEYENQLETDSDNNIEETSKFFDKHFKKKILDELGLTRYCCRRHMLGHVDLIDMI